LKVRQQIGLPAGFQDNERAMHYGRVYWLVDLVSAWLLMLLQNTSEAKCYGACQRHAWLYVCYCRSFARCAHTYTQTTHALP
jgi:hypothetical protein